MAFRSAFLAVAFHASIASLVFACNSPADDALGADEPLTGSIADAKACAVRDGYRAADLSAFQHISASQLPASVTGQRLLRPGMSVVVDVDTKLQAVADRGETFAAQAGGFVRTR